MYRHISIHDHRYTYITPTARSHNKSRTTKSLMHAARLMREIHACLHWSTRGCLQKRHPGKPKWALAEILPISCSKPSGIPSGSFRMHLGFVLGFLVGPGRGDPLKGQGVPIFRHPQLIELDGTALAMIIAYQDVVRQRLPS